MPEQTTVTGNTIIIPEIYSNVLTERMQGIIKLSALADVIGELNGSQEGDSITFPQFSSIGEAELIKKGVEITTTELNQTSTKKEVKHYGKSVRVYDQDSIEALGRWIENAEMQQAKVFARAIDKELAEDIKANAILKSSTTQANTLTEEELIAGFQLFSDEQDNDDFAGIVINSRLAPSFYTMNGFIKSDVTYVNPENGKVVNGVIGYYRSNIPVIMSDLSTYDSTTNECITFIVKKGALAIIPKRDILIELDRQAKLKATDIVGDEFFACGLIDKAGVTLLRKTIA